MKLRNHKPSGVKEFPPEAEGDFDVIPLEKSAAIREALAARFGIGKGKLRVIEEPVASN